MQPLCVLAELIRHCPTRPMKNVRFRGWAETVTSFMKDIRQACDRVAAIDEPISRTGKA